MSKPAANPVPEGFNSVTAHLVCKGAVQALEFYKKAFGAEEVFRLTAPDGSLVHGSLRIGNSTLLLTDECPSMGAYGPQNLLGSPVSIHLSVADADAAFARAIAAGATPVMPVAEMFWGARYGVFKDPYGHSWSVATQVADLTHEEIRAGLHNAFETRQNCPAVAA